MRMIPAVLAAVLAVTVAGCPDRHARPGTPGQAPRILCGTFPMYLFTLAVVEGRGGAQVTLMIPPAMGCPHDYELTVGDMRAIVAADVFIANGLGMEEYLGPPLARANPSIKVIDTSAGITDRIAMKGDEPEHGRWNPHLFASPAQAARVVRTIASELGKLDPAGKETYDKNARAYAEQLEALAREFVQAVKEFPNRRIVTEHAVFDYLARDCGLEIVAVVEEHPGQDPSAAGMVKLISTIKSAHAAAVFTEPQYPVKVSQAIAAGAGVPVAMLDAVAGGGDNAGPGYYLATMRANLKTLAATLGRKAP
ncbi:MAG: zinc ABC transporter substrate-binding protein [Planctomycetota bacterium]|nr:zinc ABC transporter substrate-binding protein [Planctomycetota bacterium]